MTIRYKTADPQQQSRILILFFTVPGTGTRGVAWWNIPHHWTDPSGGALMEVPNQYPSYSYGFEYERYIIFTLTLRLLPIGVARSEDRVYTYRHTQCPMAAWKESNFGEITVNIAEDILYVWHFLSTSWETCWRVYSLWIKNNE